MSMLETTRERLGHVLAGKPVAAPLEYGIDTLYGILHPSLLLSGATSEEEARGLSGDKLVPDPMWAATRAETIAAPPEQVWPFLVQMGWGRGGYYAYSFFDPRHTTDARGIVPRLQDLRVGDTLLDGPGSDEGRGAWTVKTIEPGRALVLHSLRDPISGRELDPKDRGHRWIDCSWAFVVEPVDPATTRLLVRTRLLFAPALARLAARFVLGPGDTVMQRTMLRGIKERAERAAARARARSQRAPAKKRGTTKPSTTRPRPKRAARTQAKAEAKS
jgi:hypothetical protein